MPKNAAPVTRPSSAPACADAPRRASRRGTRAISATHRWSRGGKAAVNARPETIAATSRARSGQPVGVNTKPGLGAVPAEHLLLIRQLTPVLHQEAAAAGELVRLRRDHLLDQCFGLVVPRSEIKNDVVLVFFNVFGALRQLLEARFDAYFLFFFSHCFSPPPAGRCGLLYTPCRNPLQRPLLKVCSRRK